MPQEIDLIRPWLSSDQLLPALGTRSGNATTLTETGTSSAAHTNSTVSDPAIASKDLDASAHFCGNTRHTLRRATPQASDRVRMHLGSLVIIVGEVNGLEHSASDARSALYKVSLRCGSMESETKPVSAEPNPIWRQSLQLSIDQDCPHRVDVQLRMLDALGSKCVGYASIDFKHLVKPPIGANPARVKTRHSLLMDATSGVVLSVSLEWTAADWCPGVLRFHSISVGNASSDMLAHGVLHVQAGCRTVSLSPRPWSALSWNPCELEFGFDARPAEDVKLRLCCDDNDEECIAAFSVNVPALVSACAAGASACTWQIELWNVASVPSLVGSTMLDARQMRREVLKTRKRMAIRTLTLPPQHHHVKSDATKANFAPSSASDVAGEQWDLTEVAPNGVQLTLCCAIDVNAEPEGSDYGQLSVCEWTAKWNGRPSSTSNLFVRLIAEDGVHQTAVAWDCTAPVWTEEWTLDVGPSQRRMLPVEHSFSNRLTSTAWLEWKRADESMWTPGEFIIRVCRASNLPNWPHARRLFLRTQLGEREQLSAPFMPAVEIEFDEIVRFWLYEEPHTSPLIMTIVAQGLDGTQSSMGCLEVDILPCIRRCCRVGGVQGETRRMWSSEVLRSEPLLLFEAGWTSAAERPWNPGVLTVTILFGADLARCFLYDQTSSHLEQHRSLPRFPWVQCTVASQSFSAPLPMQHRGDFDQEFRFTLNEPPQHDVFFEIIDKDTTSGVSHKCGSLRISTPQLIADLLVARPERIELELKLNGVSTGTLHASFGWSDDFLDSIPERVLPTGRSSGELRRTRSSDSSNGSTATLPFKKICKQIIAHGGLHLPNSTPRIPFADVLRRNVFGVKEGMEFAPALCTSVSEVAIAVLQETACLLISASYRKSFCTYNDEVLLMVGVALDQLESLQLGAPSRSTREAAATVVSMISRPRGLFSLWPANHLRTMRAEHSRITENGGDDEGPFLCIRGRQSMLQRLCCSLEHLLTVLRAHLGRLFDSRCVHSSEKSSAVRLRGATQEFLHAIELGICAITDALASLTNFSDSCRMLSDLKLVSLLDVIQDLLSLPKLRGRVPWAQPPQLRGKWMMLSIFESTALCSLNLHANPGPIPARVRILAISAVRTAHERACMLISSKQFDLALFHVNIAMSLAPADFNQRHGLFATRAVASIGTRAISSAVEDVLAGMELCPKDQTLLDLWSFLHPNQSGPSHPANSTDDADAKMSAPDPIFEQLWPGLTSGAPESVSSNVLVSDLELSWQQIVPCTNDLLLRHNLSDSGMVSVVAFAADEIARCGVELELRNKPRTVKYLVKATVAKTLERVKTL